MASFLVRTVISDDWGSVQTASRRAEFPDVAQLNFVAACLDWNDTKMLRLRHVNIFKTEAHCDVTRDLCPDRT